MPNATVRQLLATKDPVIHSITGKTSVAEAVSIMNDNRIGALIVLTQSTGMLGGIFTERDILTRIVAQGLDPTSTLVKDVMTSSVHVISPEVTVEHAMAVMTKNRCRHLPVVTPAGILGMISIGDLTRWSSLAHQREADYLRDYLSGIPAA